MAQNRMLKEFVVPNLDQWPLCIHYPLWDVNLELKLGLIHLLPSFHGFPSEDPDKHLKEFYIVCSSMELPSVTEEQIKLRAFPFSLKDEAKEYLYYLPPGTIETLNVMKIVFLEHYFPASKVGSIQKEICGIKQVSGESLYENYEHFKRSMIDTASGGALVDKTPTTARSLISNMATNSQQYNPYPNTYNEGWRDHPNFSYGNQ
uniref:Retrotransposon gag domain-containing protein n=1 Tax=Cannabis sativa TaxID=3483 RepID=A0A803PAT8_CANSA